MSSGSVCCCSLCRKARMLHVDKSCVLKIFLGNCHRNSSLIHRAPLVDYSLATEQLFRREHGSKTFEICAYKDENDTCLETEKLLIISQIRSIFPQLSNMCFDCIEVDPDG